LYREAYKIPMNRSVHLMELANSNLGSFFFLCSQGLVVILSRTLYPYLLDYVVYLLKLTNPREYLLFAVNEYFFLVADFGIFCLNC